MISHAHHHHPEPEDHSTESKQPHIHARENHRKTSQRLILIVLVMTFVCMIAEAVGGYFSNSLALLSDAGHMLTDVAALALSLFAVRFASRPATPSKTYGFYRLEILAALANGVTLIVLSLLICYEAYHRFLQPEDVKGVTLLLISSLGLIVNLISAYLLSKAHQGSLNVRGALLHVLGDLLGSIAAIAAGVLIIWRGWTWADPLFSVVISFLIIFSSWRLVADAVNILLEATPSHINAASVEQAIRKVDGVHDVHDLHIWTITSDRHALTAHVVVNDARDSYRVLRQLREMLAEQFALTHSTIQIEDPTFSTMVDFGKK
ncbi:MAG: cation diffusion facilitator family transporter [Acidobacteria bacterium]|nr:cation diffusion facilitator family transporter [Acidobacteriota bacterium]